MTKRNRNIKNIFIKLQMGTNIMANQVKTPIQNYFEKVLYENLTFEIVFAFEINLMKHHDSISSFDSVTVQELPRK
jgi:hypothetical protein